MAYRDLEKHRAWARANYQANKKTILAQRRARYHADPEKFVAMTRAWQQANPEKFAALQKTWKEANPEKVKEGINAYKRANREKVNAKERASYLAKKLPHRPPADVIPVRLRDPRLDVKFTEVYGVPLTKKQRKQKPSKRRRAIVTPPTHSS
jgi:ABC-type nitrate/sulfonate/bicarbonate transport system substrate-binding protein